MAKQLLTFASDYHVIFCVTGEAHSTNRDLGYLDENFLGVFATTQLSMAFILTKQYIQKELLTHKTLSYIQSAQEKVKQGCIQSVRVNCISIAGNVLGFFFLLSAFCHFQTSKLTVI